MKTYELIPENRKSFYGKAVVLETPEGHKYLDSYNTRVASFIDGYFECTKNEKHLTNTTLRHITAFRLHLGLPKLTKQQLLNI